ncbi:MAG: hypothetical protein J7521_04760 [Caulobacter sp.]|nr:hypothetical protein [Caulobacter sp.]
MRVKSWLQAISAPLLATLLLSGCAPSSAPSLSLFGAYFPVWILCGVLGVVAAITTRLLLVVSGLAETLPAQLLLCVAVGVIAACLTWLWLGQ